MLALSSRPEPMVALRRPLRDTGPVTDPHQPGEPGQPQHEHEPQPGYAPPGQPQQDYPQQGYPQQGYPQQGHPPPTYPQGAYPPPYGYPPVDSGQTMGIVGFVLAFVFAPAGIVFSAVGRSQSRQAGFDNQLATWGFWLSIVFTSLGVLYVLFWVLLIFGGLFAAASYGGTTVGLTV